MSISKEQLIQRLQLTPLEPEGGFFHRTYLSNSGHGSAIFYLIDDQNFSQLHRLKCDEIFHFYAGDEVELFTFDDSSTLRRHVLGSPLNPNNEYQVLVPANTWQGLRLTKSHGWALLGTTCFPAFSFDLFELGERSSLIQKHPNLRSIIEQFTL